MFVTFAVVQVIICSLLVLVILLQEGKKGMGAIFGGSSTSIFGARGAANILTKITSILAILFMLNSVWLSYISSKNTSVVDSVKVEEKAETSKTEPVKTVPVEEKKVEPKVPVEEKVLDAPVEEKKVEAKVPVEEKKLEPEPSTEKKKTEPKKEEVKE